MNALRLDQALGEALPREAAVTDPAASLLRFITCGSVDDGKSTLIGRLLYEAGTVPDDQLEAVSRDSRKFGTTGEATDFALLVDGLSAEREQGITIDVAYRYFATSRRAFIVADTPGHEQYTRNMATGASTADLAVILIDARKGLLPQTHRHAFIVSLLGVRHVVVAVNKMDLVGYDVAVFERIAAAFHAIAGGLGFRSIACIPVSAREGDNIVGRSAHMNWYGGEALLPHLETVETEAREEASATALPIQWVNRPDQGFRGYSGTLAAGTLRSGAAVTALPSGVTTRIARILGPEGALDTAVAGQALTVVTADEIDLSRGDVLVAEQGPIRVARGLTVRLLVTAPRTVTVGASLIVKLGAASTNAVVTAIHHAIDIETFAETPADSIAMNGIGLVTLRLDRPLAAAPYAASSDLGGLILIDRISNETVAFGMVAAMEEPHATADRKSLTTGEQTTRGGAAWLLGEPGTMLRRARLTALSWRLASAALFAVAAYVLSGSAAFAVALAAVDGVARSLLRTGHALIWQRLSPVTRGAGASENGAGI